MMLLYHIYANHLSFSQKPFSPLHLRKMPKRPIV